MFFEPEIVSAASARLARRKEARERQRFQLQQTLYREHPRLKELDRELSRTMIELVELSISGKGLSKDDPRILDIRTRNLALQKERSQRMASLGYPDDAIDLTPACSQCGDSGWVGGRMCTCLRDLCAQEQLKALTSLLQLTPQQDFAHFRLDVYSDQPWENATYTPRQNMERIVTVCRSYATRFGDFPIRNLLFSGGTGLGKTFLSGCIAREVSGQGKSVVYDSAIAVFDHFDTKRFSRSSEEVWEDSYDATHRYLACDLLILDDLGSEMVTAPVRTSFYELVNTRLMKGRHTIISTNLSVDALASRYSPQIASRILGNYRDFAFYGPDLRMTLGLNAQ